VDGIVAEVKGLLSYKIKLKDGSFVRRHVDSVKSRTTEESTDSLPETMPDDDNFDSVTSQEDEGVSSTELVSSAPTPVTIDGPAELSGLLQSIHIRRPPKRYGQEFRDT